MDEKTFQTGDILLFEHENDYSSITKIFFTLVSKVIRLFTKSKYSHTAIIVKDPMFFKKKGLYIMESSVENKKDVENNQYKIGVQLQDFRQMISNWKGHVYWRQLKCKRDLQFNIRFSEIHSLVHNRPYDLIPTDWVKAGLHLKFGNIKRFKTFWCSALVAFIYNKLGLLPQSIGWSVVTPEQFGTETNAYKPLQFTNCIVLPEKQIK